MLFDRRIDRMRGCSAAENAWYGCREMLSVKAEKLQARAEAEDCIFKFIYGEIKTLLPQQSGCEDKPFPTEP
jgi:hypothetical protein